MNLDRRQFARAASSGIALFVVPGWFAACQRARDSERTSFGPGERPLLLLHVSDDWQRRDQLGEVFGVFLLNASDEELALLATCDIACATTAELERAGVESANVHAVLQAPGEPALAAIAGEIPFPVYNPYVFRLGEPQPEPITESFDDWIVPRVAVNHAWLSAQLARALGPGSRAFELGLARDAVARGPVSADVAPTSERATATPCLAFEQAQRHPEHRSEWLLLLATQVRDRWSVVGPPGSGWARGGGCGEELELPSPAPSWQVGPRLPSLMVGCGQAYIPEISRRFLRFHCESLNQVAPFDLNGFQSLNESLVRRAR
jgi:hypothetical protein